jgi:hypothetical protein
MEPESQERLHWMVEDFRSDVRYAEESLNQAAAVVIDRAQRLQERLQNGYSINDLGELQSSGSDVDRLCAVVGERRKALLRVERIEAMAVQS